MSRESGRRGYRLLGAEERSLLRWLISEKNIELPDLCRMLGVRDRHLRGVLSGDRTIDIDRFERLLRAVVSPWAYGTFFERIDAAALDEFNSRLLAPFLGGMRTGPSSPPSSRVGLHRLVLLAKSASADGLQRRYPLTTKLGAEVGRISLSGRRGPLSAVVRRHILDKPRDRLEWEPLSYAARFDISVPALGQHTVAVLRVWPKNRAQFTFEHDVHLTLNGLAFDSGVAASLAQELLHGIASRESLTVHCLDLYLDVEAPYRALTAFQRDTLPGIGFFRRLESYAEDGVPTGVCFGRPDGHHRVVIYDKTREVGRRAETFGTYAPTLRSFGDPISATRFEFRAFPHRLGATSSLDSCLTTMPKLWNVWTVADHRQFRGACPALLYLAFAQQAGQLRNRPIAHEVRDKVHRHDRWVAKHPDARVGQPLSASERVLLARLRRRAPIDVAEREALVFHQALTRTLEYAAEWTNFSIGGLIEAKLPVLQAELAGMMPRPSAPRNPRPFGAARGYTGL